MNARSMRTYRLMSKLDESGKPVYAFFEVENPPPPVVIGKISPDFSSEKEAEEWRVKSRDMGWNTTP